MTFTRGRCTNFDYCTIADRRQAVQVALGQDFVCPECGKPLKPPADSDSGQGGGARLALIGVAAIAVLGGGGFAAWSLLGSGGKTAPAPAATSNPVPAQQAAAPAPAPAPPAPPPLPETVMLRLSGSNTIGANLGPQLARAFLSANGDSNVAIEPGGKADEVRVTGQRGQTREVITVAAHGSATAFTDLEKGAADIGMSSRRVKPAEKESLAALGDLTGAASEHVLALDGIAVIVNPGNTVPALTKAQLQGIFSGAIKDWAQVGAAAGPIHVLARDDKSGTFDTFKSLVLGTAKISPDAKRLEDSRELSTEVTQDRQAIGFIGLPYILSARPVPVAETGATPLLPNRLTVGTEDYALSRRLYLYTAAQPQNPLAARFTEYALSPLGQAIVEQSGFVPLTIKQEAAPVPQTASARYKALVGRATRLSTNFRFQANSVVLDNRAARDLDRLVNFVVSVHAQPKDIILIGFADNKGRPSANVEVSRKRAAAVADGLAQRGLKVGNVAAFGSELPVADNATEDGREKNRRVEVYINLQG